MSSIWYFHTFTQHITRLKTSSAITKTVNISIKFNIVAFMTSTRTKFATTNSFISIACFAYIKRLICMFFSSFVERARARNKGRNVVWLYQRWIVAQATAFNFSCSTIAISFTNSKCFDHMASVASSCTVFAHASSIFKFACDAREELLFNHFPPCSHKGARIC